MSLCAVVIDNLVGSRPQVGSSSEYSFRVCRMVSLGLRNDLVCRRHVILTAADSREWSTTALPDWAVPGAAGEQPPLRRRRLREVPRDEGNMERQRTLDATPEGPGTMRTTLEPVQLLHPCIPAEAITNQPWHGRMAEAALTSSVVDVTVCLSCLQCNGQRA